MLISEDAATAGLICYQNTLIQVLLSCANDLSFQVMTISVSIGRPVVSANFATASRILGGATPRVDRDTLAFGS
jgi:hypothetical protein